MKFELRNRIPHDEFDYQTLLSALKEYRHPRGRIHKLLRQGRIIRVKKGLYVFGEEERKGPIHREHLANLIYGPSYVSLDYALAFHGWIPERVETVSSVTTQRAKSFDTPLGRFTYRRIPVAAFRSGVHRVDMGQGRVFLMANPEKALADKLYCDRIPLDSQKAVYEYVINGLRIEEESLRSLDPNSLDDIASRFGSAKILHLSKLVRRMIRRTGGRSNA